METGIPYCITLTLHCSLVFCGYMDPAWRSPVWETFETNFNKDLISDCVLVVGESEALCVWGRGGVYQHVCVYAFITFIYGVFEYKFVRLCMQYNYLIIGTF